MADGYWDLDAIACGQTRITATFRTAVFGYGFMENKDRENLDENSVVEMAYWLAKPLALHGTVGLDIPNCFSSLRQDDLYASPQSVNLASLCPYFFRFGANVLRILDIANLAKLLLDTFKQRLRLINDYTNSSRIINDLSTFLQFLDATEYRMYEIGLEAAQAKAQWAKRDLRLDDMRIEKRRRLH